MNKSKIEWCDMTWNPVTGCLHGCEYCYARKIANRFGFQNFPETPREKIHVLSANGVFLDEVGKIMPYPFKFEPTFHRSRLNEPSLKTKPQNIFVCSMADLFGDWVPDEWIEAVFDACENAPQHRYLFLTKNPKRYKILQSSGRLPHEHWYGTTVTEVNRDYFSHSDYRSFLSIEPIMCEMRFDKRPQQVLPDWVIVGAETGNRKDKVVPKAEWITEIIEACDRQKIPVFMKNSLVPIVGEANMRREFPW